MLRTVGKVRRASIRDIASWDPRLGDAYVSLAPGTGTACAATLRAIALDPTFFESHHELAWLGVPATPTAPATS